MSTVLPTEMEPTTSSKLQNVESRTTESASKPEAANSKTNGAARGAEIPVEKNVFYNEETLKYMRIIDMYKRLGIGKDIELPRV